MGRRSHKLSAKNFVEPLLMVLGAQTNYTPGSQVYFKDTYQAIVDQMGLDLDEFGVQDSTGKPWVHQWIGFAFKTLKNNNGHCAQNMKGRWELTESGCREARRLAGLTEVATVETSTATVAPAVVEPAMPVTIGGQSFVTPSVPDGFYHHDSYIRSIAIANTRCFGNFSDRSRVCSKCPLKEACIQYMAVEFSALAAQMRREEVEAEERKNRAVADPVVDEIFNEDDEQKTEAPTGDGKPSAKGMEKIVAALESDCAHCGKTIPKGEKCCWSPGSGLYHVSCVEGSP